MRFEIKLQHSQRHVHDVAVIEINRVSSDDNVKARSLNFAESSRISMWVARGMIDISACSCSISYAEYIIF